MSHAMINTLIDAFEMKIRSEKALAEYRLQTELTNLRQSLLSVLPQNRSTSNYEINALQEEQQMLRDMVSELQDSLEGMNRRFISSRLSVGSLEEKINPEESSSEESDEDGTVVAVSRGAVLKNEIVYPAIHVEKQNHEEPVVVLSTPVVKKPIIAPAPAPPVVTKKPEPEPEHEHASEEEEAEEEEESEKESPDVSVPEEESEEEEEEEESEELELEEFTFKGKTYYKDDENNVYNEDGDVIGRKVGANVVFKNAK